MNRARMALAPVVCVAMAAVGAGCAGGSDSPSHERGPSDDPGACSGEAGVPTRITLDEATAARVRVTTAPVVELATGAPIAALGALAVDEHRLAIVDAPAAGRVVRLLAHVGDLVEPGDALAEIESGDVGAMRGDLTSATARVRTAEAALERRRALAAEHVASTADVEDAENALALARADVDRARAGLRAADASGTARSSLLVRSPLGGTVLEHHAFPGEAASEDDRLFEIADLTALWLLVHVPERDASNVRAGDVARVTFAGRPGGALELAVALVGRTVEEDSRTVELRFDVDNSDGSLRPGMAASVLLVPATSDGTTLVAPTGAVQHTSFGWAVFVPSGEREYELRRVVTGRDFGGEVEIVTGVSAGDEVAVEGAFLLRSLADAGDWGEAG